MIHLAKEVVRAAIRRAGYDIVRVGTSPRRTPSTMFDFTDLAEYRQATDVIPGMVSSNRTPPSCCMHFASLNISKEMFSRLGFGKESPPRTWRER